MQRFVQTWATCVGGRFLWWSIFRYNPENATRGKPVKNGRLPDKNSVRR